VKRFVLGFGLLGLIGCFLPLAIGVSLFDLRHFEHGWHVWLVLASFAVPAYVGATESDKTAGVVGSVAFGYLAYKFGTGVFDLVFHASIGGLMIGVAVILGLATSVMALCTPDPTSRR
jgi:hypothetical protein